MGRIYKKQIQIDFNECDFTAKAKLSTILKHFADIAGNDYTERGLSHKYLWDNNVVFLLSKFSINFERPIYDDDIVTIETYERMIKGAFFYRDYIIKNSDNESVIFCKSTWVVCDPTTRRLLRPTSVNVQLSPCDEHIPCDEPTKLFRGENLTLVGERKIVYSDLDNNLHLYNAKYADIVCDFLPIELLKKNVKTFKINFEKEAYLNETLEIYTDIKENFVQSVGMKGKELSYIAELTFEE